MPISKRTIERWVCDRCGKKQEYPDSAGESALEAGWLAIDFTRPLTQTWTIFSKNEQILCPRCVTALGNWFKNPTPPTVGVV